jgi:hypothetical protein
MQRASISERNVNKFRKIFVVGHKDFSDTRQRCSWGIYPKVFSL